jgi:diguanylate cyclase (GGDEF)-like protein/PAS domain S-box-containing protein
MNAEIAATVAAGSVIVTLTVLAVRRTASARAAFTASAGYAVWTAACVGLFVGLPEGVFWAVLRPLIIVLMSLAVATTPGATRTGREWLELLLDGWMTVGGLFGLFWIAAQAQTADPHRAGNNPQLLWLIAQTLLISMVGGLLARAAPGHRGAPMATFVLGATVLAGDELALVTGDPRIGIPFWLGSGLAVAACAWIFGGDVYVDTFLPPEQPIPIRFWQLPIPFFLAYVCLPQYQDSVLDATMAVVLTGLVLQLFLHSRRNVGLWHSLRERTRMFEEMLLDSQDVILQVDDQGVVEFVNPASAAVLDVAPSELIGTVLRDRIHPADQIQLGSSVTIDGSPREPIRMESRFSAGRPPGEWRHIDWTLSPRGGTTRGWIMTGRNITERVALQKELVIAARTDLLTGLLNRGAFLVAVGTRLAAGPAAVLFIDLDGFKAVNDTMGHGQGDEVLRRAAECLRQAVGPSDLVARLGGDEFAVLADSPDPDTVQALADDVVTAFNGFDEMALGRPSVSASVGAAIADRGTAIELLRDADLAMYRAKQRGGAGRVQFESWMSERVMEHSRLRADLDTAVRNEGLALYLQPVVDLHTRQWVGFEALVRWPVGRETWSPAQFLPVAEESGLIVPMGAWVLREALRQLAGWRDDTLGMAVNVSALQLVGTDFYDVTMEALASSGISPDRLTLEITEQAAIQDLGRTASRLESLRAEGVHVAIDDFGTGFSSLQYLSRLPVDILKIDRKFVWGLGQQAEDDVLVRSMLGLAAELGLQVIAEGVETRRQADLLLEYGCRLAQGFLFSPPRPIEELRSSDPFVSPAPAARSVTPLGAIPVPRTGESGKNPAQDLEKADRAGQSG